MQETAAISGGFAALVATIPILWLFVSLGGMKMAAPKAAVAALVLGLAANLPGREGELLFTASRYALAFTLVLGGVVFLFG